MGKCERNVGNLQKIEEYSWKCQAMPQNVLHVTEYSVLNFSARTIVSRELDIAVLLIKL